MSISCLFFFKQKTAYEMRISDWSSDVCSSDLAKLRDREEQLKLALWATGEHYWDYDLASGKLRRFQPDDETTRPDGLARLSGPVEVDQVLHPDDLPLAQDNLRRYLEGATPMFRSEHRVLDNLGQWVWIRARGRAVSRSEEHTSELQSLMRSSYAVFCLKKT